MLYRNLEAKWCLTLVVLLRKTKKRWILMKSDLAWTARQLVTFCSMVYMSYFDTMCVTRCKTKLYMWLGVKIPNGTPSSNTPAKCEHFFSKNLQTLLFMLLKELRFASDVWCSGPVMNFWAVWNITSPLHFHLKLLIFACKNQASTFV